MVSSKRYSIEKFYEAAKKLNVSRQTIHEAVTTPKAKPRLPSIRQRMPGVIKVPLSCFLARLKEAKQAHPDWTHLDQVGWLIRNFRFDDNAAVYEPQPVNPYETLIFQWARDQKGGAMHKTIRMIK